ncbi:YncE family protein [Tenacibaculum singaporense]|uniref:Cell surface protein n=1 Tax=Tenacibaculum singaporense TaxID=2358479 RepID=A0A3Q8RNQ4_9FLAO|nr:DUF5074 domain-containing protein [Tenacibaculum singaporense]AZJ35706.1 cell surface protein [Tenacibaculum singaporense]
MKITKLLLQLFLVSIVLTSCSSEDKIVEVSREAYDNGIIISSEGNFGAKDGSISFLDSSIKESENFVYAGVNGALLGGLIQSITFTDTEAYIILNDVNTIVVVDRVSFKKKGQITTGFNTPRYMTVLGSKGYVTNWGATDNESDDFVAIVDLNSLKVEGKIDVELGPEQILNKDNKLYVSHKGAYGSNNIISIIDLNDNNSISTVTVKDKPDEIAFDGSGNLIVLSEGKAAYTGDETLGAISKVNIANKTVEEIVFPEGVHPSLMTLDNNNLYYSIGAKVYKMGVNDSSLPASEIITVDLFTDESKGAYILFYGMGVKEGRLYALNTSFVSTSEVQVFNLSDNKKVKSFEVGVGASKIYFN